MTTITSMDRPLEAAFPAHVSHKLLETGYNTECHNCWGCSCHSSDILIAPCTYSLTVEVEPLSERVIEAVSRQAARYGEQIRILGSAGLERDRAAALKAWDVFRFQLKGTDLMIFAHNSYYEAYDQ